MRFRLAELFSEYYIRLFFYLKVFSPEFFQTGMVEKIQKNTYNGRKPVRIKAALLPLTERRNPMKKETSRSTEPSRKPGKARRILALIGVILLLGLYASTLFCALFAGENFMRLLMASIYATVVIPVLLWAYSFLYNLIRGHRNDPSDSERS